MKLYNFPWDRIHAGSPYHRGWVSSRARALTEWYAPVSQRPKPNTPAYPPELLSLARGLPEQTECFIAQRVECDAKRGPGLHGWRVRLSYRREAILKTNLILMFRISTYPSLSCGVGCGARGGSGTLEAHHG
jgi:hypothetical protein